MLKRKMENVLKEWKQNNPLHPKALCLFGARQTGKSTLARSFGEKNYTQVIEINFILEPQAKKIFVQVNGAKEILRNITAYTKKEIYPHRTLIIFDEIQECPEARTMIKALVEDNTCDYIETGSLLGVRFKEIRSYPVGFEQIESVYPLDFEEFLWALQIPQETIDYLRNCFIEQKTVSESIHQTMLKSFYNYIVIGGMPEVVQTFINTNDIAQCIKLQLNIIELYRSDIAQYAEKSDKNKIRDILDQIPSQLNAKNNRFKISSISKNARFSHFEAGFLWLSEAGVALPCFNCSAPVLPLDLNIKRNLFKLYLCDTGLLCAMSMQNLQFDLLQGEVQINHGSILENVFAQELASRNIPLTYYDQKKLGELDFIVQNGHTINIFEIKSGNDFQKHSALSQAIEKEEWHLDHNFVFSKHNLLVKDKITYLPFYMVMFYKINKQPKSLNGLNDLSFLLPPSL